MSHQHHCKEVEDETLLWTCDGNSWLPWLFACPKAVNIIK